MITNSSNEEKRSIVTLFEYIYVIFLILGTRSLYAHPLEGDYRITEIFAVATFILLFLKYRATDGKLMVNKRVFTVLFGYFILVIIYAAVQVSTSWFITFFARYILIVPLNILLFCLYAEGNETEELFQKFVKVMCLISAISLFFWLLGSLMGIISPTGSFLSSWGAHLMTMRHRAFYGVYFDRQRTSFFGYSGYRNCGIFTEAPMHALILIFTVSLELFIVEKKTERLNLRRLILLSITLVTTFSSTGIILLLLIGIMYLYIHLPQNLKYRLILMGASLPVFIVAIYIAYTVFETKSTETISWIQRMNGTSTALSYFASSPIFGTGYGGSDFRQELTAGNLGFSFSAAAVLAEGGIMLSLVYWVPIVSAIVKSIVYKERHVACIAIIYAFQFTTSLCENAILMFVLLAYLITYNPADLLAEDNELLSNDYC